ncbi:MAG: tetratricopeptide repeat protein [Chloroflexi bacterium]|nr:tetratricopeptide repeat protein [Chloroflexota bacterium]
MKYASLSIGDHISDFDTFLARIAEARTTALSTNAVKEFSEARIKILDDLNQRKFHLQQSQVSEHSPDSRQTMSANVAEAIRAMESQALAVIIERWLHCVRTIPQQEKFVLLLDNYDVYQDLVSLDEIRLFWATMERARQFLPNFRVVLASREVVLHREHVEALRRGLSGEDLGDLSREDSRALLDALGVTDAHFCDAVYRFANGHPLMTRMAAEVWKESAGEIAASDVPNFSGREEAVGWLQTFILNRLKEPLRSAAQWMAVLRWFSFEALNAILDAPITEEEYRKLTAYSFVVPSKLREGYKAAHDLVRKVQIAHLRREQPSKFVEVNRRAMRYSAAMDAAGLETLYHQFFIAPDEAFKIWQEIESQAAFHFDHQRWGLLFELALRDELSLPPAMLAEIQYRAGRRHYYRAEWFLAMDYYNEALKLFEEIGAKLGEANVLQAIGDVQQFRDERDAALESYQKALGLFREIGDRLGEANVLKAIGDVQQFRDERDAALESYQKALGLYSEIGAKLGEANVLQAIGDVQQFRKQVDAALESYQKARGLYSEIGAKLGEANVLKAIGDVQQFRKQVDAALESYLKALGLYSEIGAKLGEANVLQAIGDKFYPCWLKWQGKTTLLLKRFEGLLRNCKSENRPRMEPRNTSIQISEVCQ